MFTVRSEHQCFPCTDWGAEVRGPVYFDPNPSVRFALDQLMTSTSRVVLSIYTKSVQEIVAMHPHLHTKDNTGIYNS